MSDEKFPLYLPYIETPLPDPTSGTLVCIALNEEWVGLLQGLIYHLNWRFVWKMSPTDIDLMHAYVQKLSDVLGGQCPMLTDIRIEGNELQAKVCGSDEWVTKGEIPTPEPVEPEMRVFDGFIQWKASNEATWHDLIALEDLRGEDGIDGSDAPIPVFEWDGYQLKIDANADGTFDVTSPSLRGATGSTGGNGTNAPIPAFRFVTDGGQVAMQIDADDNGSWDYTSPNLKGQDAAPCECDSDTIIYGIPPIMDEDRVCRAAWLLARNLCDEFGDLINIFGVGEKLLASAAQSFLELFPPSLFADDTIEFLTEDLPGETMEWVTGQAGDDDVIKAVAELLYCSIKDHYPDNLDSVLDDIDLGLYDPELLGLAQGKLHMTWANFTAIAQSIYDTLTGDAVKYMVLGFAKISARQLLEFGGMVSSVEKVMASAINTAQYFDSRDCVDFGCNEEPCIVFDLTEELTFPDALNYTGDGSGLNGTFYAGIGLQAAQGTDSTGYFYRTVLRVFAPVGCTFTSVTLGLDLTGASGSYNYNVQDKDFAFIPPTGDIYVGTIANPLTINFEFEGDGHTLIIAVTSGHTADFTPGAANGDPFVIQNVEICWDGVNPFE